MSQFKTAAVDESEAEFRQFLSFLFAQGSSGIATTGVLAGLGVTQTTTASKSVVIGKGAAVVQSSLTAGVSPLISNADVTLDVLTGSPMGALPRNDLVIFNADSVAIEAVIGTPNASPTDPAVSANHIKLARLRQIPTGSVGAGTIPAANIDPLGTFTSLFGAKAQGKRSHWATYTTGNTDSSGYVTVAHGAGFTPSAVVVSAAVTTFASAHADAVLSCDSFTATTFRLRAVKTETGAVLSGLSFVVSAFLGE